MKIRLIQERDFLSKTRVENVRFLSWRIFFVGKYGIQSTNEMAFNRTLTLRTRFDFPPSDLMRPRYGIRLAVHDY